MDLAQRPALDSDHNIVRIIILSTCAAVDWARVQSGIVLWDYRLPTVNLFKIFIGFITNTFILFVS